MSTITLENVRACSDITMKVRLKDNGVAVDWSGLTDIKALVYSDDQKAVAGRCAVSVDSEDPTVLVCLYAATKPQYLGVNSIVVRAKYMGREKTYDKQAVNIVARTAELEGEQVVLEDPEVTVDIEVTEVDSSILDNAIAAAFDAADRAEAAAAAAEQMVDIHTGPAGKSAYEVAVDEGYTGTEEQWLASLKGETGDTPDISIGTVTTVEPGEPAAASMSGTPEAPVLNLSIPKGLVGATPNFTVGTVTTGQPGTPVVVEITGTAEAPVLNITIPQGAQGNTGSSVEYPFELVNNLTTDDATKALSAAQGVVLDGKVSQLEAEVGNFPDKNLPYGTPTSGKYVNYQGGQLYDSGVNSAITGVDVSALVGRTLYYSRAQIPAAAGNQGMAFYGTNGYISGVQGALNAPAWGIALDTVVVPEGALTASFTCPTAELSSFQLYVKTSAESEIADLKTGLSQVEQDMEGLEDETLHQLQNGGCYKIVFEWPGGASFQYRGIKLFPGNYRYTTGNGIEGYLQDGAGNNIINLYQGQTDKNFTVTESQSESIVQIAFYGGDLEISSVNDEVTKLGEKTEKQIFDLQEEVAGELGYERTYEWVSGTYTKFPVHYEQGTKIKVETDDAANVLYFENSSGQSVITVSGVTTREITLTQEQAAAIVDISIYGGDFTLSVYGIKNDVAELKDKIDDSVYLTSSGSYAYKKIEYDFQAFGFYKVTVKSTTAASIGFQGLVDATSESGEYQFTLKSGESILWTPAKSYKALYFGATGSFSIEVEIYGPSTINKVHTFYCGPTRQYTKFTDAIKAATLYMNSVLFVDEGVYDIISELGADYFNMTESNYSAGPVLKNGIKVIATPGTRIVCNYTGDNNTVMTVFSPLNSGPYGFTLSGVHIEASRVRYAIHDELNSTAIPSKCRYENCFMSLDNSNNPVWRNASCIGGGLAAHEVVDVLDSIFHPIGNEYKNGIYYHEAATAQDFDFKINIAGNYLVDGAIIFQMSNEMQGKNNYITVHDNNVPNDARLSSGSVVVKDGGAFTTNVVLEWNNIKRS